MKHLTFTSTTEHHFLGEYDGKVYLPDAGHLTTFVPGNWLLGAELLQEDNICQAAFKLLDSAWATHDMSPCDSFSMSLIELNSADTAWGPTSTVSDRRLPSMRYPANIVGKQRSWASIAQSVASACA